MFGTLSLAVVISAAVSVAAAPAVAQSTLPGAPANPTVPIPLPDTASPPPEKIAPPNSNRNKQEGTITPPNVDPGMTVSPPRNTEGTTAVIPPPGSSGSGNSVIPK